MSVLWTEKYRPKDISTFESLPHIKNFSNNNSVNLLLYGPPGTGKTTFAHLLAGKNKLELNASDERGISTVRDKIKNYASTLKKDKTIILDECENLTEDAQHCLRRIIEDSKHTRFIFTTNYLSRVISPLKSRLVKIKFEIQECNTLQIIGEAEELAFSDSFYKELFVKCNYDLRRSINVLQALAPLSLKDDQVVDDIIGIVPKLEIDKFIDITRNNYVEFISRFLKMGYPVLQFIYQLSEYDFINLNRYKFLLLLAELEEKLILGCSDETVLTKICLYKLKLSK